MQYHFYWHQVTERTHIDRRLAWLRGVHATMEPHLATGGCTNGMDPELTGWRTACHGDDRPKKQQVKAACEPQQLFTFPQAVTPGPGAG